MKVSDIRAATAGAGPLTRGPATPRRAAHHAKGRTATGAEAYR